MNRRRISPRGKTTTSVYDDLNRMIQTVYADGTTNFTGYDVAGRRVAETNQDSVVTRFGYDGAGRLIAVTNVFGTSQQMVTQYHYDEAGNQIDQVDALGHTTTFAYDAMGRRIKRTLPGTQAETMGYDLAGNLRFATNFNGVIITNQYDVMNRLTNRSSINGYQVSFTYAPTGQRETMVDSTGVTTSIYDARDRLVTKSVDWPGYGEIVSLHYVYDESGRVTDISSSTINGVRLHYDYDPLGRLTNVLSRGWAAAGYGFDGVGNLQSIRYGNGVTNRYDYDSMNRLTNLVWKSGTTPLASFYYQLGKTGNRTNLVENVNSIGRTNIWQYDALYRMTNETIVGLGSLGYVLDKVGNRLTRTSSGSLTGTLPATTATFTANDWLNTDIYDSNGNTLWSGTGAGGTNYYDVENRLTNFNDGAVLLEYNGDGTRTKKVLPNDSSSNPVHYLVDDRNPTGYPQVLEEHWGNANARGVSNVFAYGLTLIAQQDLSANEPVASYYFISDGHGSTRLLLDTNATVVGTFLYDAYGNLVTSNATVSTKYLYCGEQFDSDLGMYYLRARYYKPETGRFWTMDSYEGHQDQGQSLHKYAYAEDDPIDAKDPAGNRPIDFAFDAFINGDRGTWLTEPGSVFSQFKTDARDFGQFDKSAGNARVYSYGNVESTKIGRAEQSGVQGTSRTGVSHKRSAFSLIGILSGGHWGPIQARQAEIENPLPVIRDVNSAETTVTFNPSAGYPFLPSLATPNIDYTITFDFKIVSQNRVSIVISGSHNLFPDYEGYIDGSLLYKWKSPSSGPNLINLNRRKTMLAGPTLISADTSR